MVRIPAGSQSFKGKNSKCQKRCVSVFFTLPKILNLIWSQANQGRQTPEMTTKTFILIYFK